MDGQKITGILDVMRDQGRLPTDQFGQVLRVDDPVGWLGLDGCLLTEEMASVRSRLAAMVEAQLARDQIKIHLQPQEDGQA